MNRSHGPEAGRLLVVDDNKVNRLLLVRGLQQQGHQVAYAENGRQALEMLRGEPFDLVLLDIEMPEMDGFEVLEVLTTDRELRNISVVMTSAQDELDIVAKCIELGADDFLTKPVNPILLKARIGTSLEKKRLRDQQRELLRKFATTEVAEELMATGFSLGGKYVDATAMFADIRSFTAIAESQSPEDTIELLNTFYTLMFDAITGQDGVVNQIVGDGLMAIFGAPMPKEDHAERAVRAALEMVELIELFNQEQAMQDKVQIRIGIGIASGRMIAGYTGTSERATYTCVGETVNLAARLEGQTKELGQAILIDENTRSGLSEAMQVNDLGLTALKGFGDKVQVYSVPTGQGA